MENNLPKIQIKRYIQMQFISVLIFLVIILIVISLAFIFTKIILENISSLIVISSGEIISEIIVWTGFFVLICIVFCTFQIWSLATITYELKEKFLTIRGGIIARYEKNLLFSKIQHVVVTQSFFERIFGLSKVIVQTAGNDFSIVQQGVNQNQQLAFNQPVIPCLLKEDAEKIKQELILKISKFRGQGL